MGMREFRGGFALFQELGFGPVGIGRRFGANGDGDGVRGRERELGMGRSMYE